MMAGLLKNSTIGVSTTSSSTSNYGFPSSGSFTHQKQPIMPMDQKAKLLAMHRDGKANAGIYVAIVLFVYFILVILLLCRYGRRRRTTSEQPGLDSSAEQGRCPLLSYYIRRVGSCGGTEGCYSCCLPNSVPFCSRRCQQMEGSGKPTGTTTILNLTDSGKDLGKSVSSMLAGKGDSDQAEQNRISEVPVPVPPAPAEDKKGTTEGDCGTFRGELKDQQSSGITGHQHHNEDSDNEESMEED